LAKPQSKQQIVFHKNIRETAFPCGHECHADHNAAVNIRENFLKLRASVNVPIVVCPEMGT
jgi:transposase